MSVSIGTSSIFNIRRIDKFLFKDYPKTKYLFDWIFAAEGAGNASGGSVNANIDFGSLEPTTGKKIYFAITGIFPYSSGASGDKYLYTHTDRMEIYKFPGHANEMIVPWFSDDAGISIPHRDQIHGMLYLGCCDPDDAARGTFTFTFTTNTDSTTYNLTIIGFATDRPLSLSHTTAQIPNLDYRQLQ
jgi:hypothetical protein